MNTCALKSMGKQMLTPIIKIVKFLLKSIPWICLAWVVIEIFGWFASKYFYYPLSWDDFGCDVRNVGTLSVHYLAAFWSIVGFIIKWVSIVGLISFPTYWIYKWYERECIRCERKGRNR